MQRIGKKNQSPTKEYFVNQLPKELREKVVKAYERNVGTINEVASIFDLSPRTVAKYLHVHRVEGDLTPKPHTGRIPILTEERLEIVQAIVFEILAES